MNHRIAVLLFPGFQLLDAAGPIAAFEIAARAVPGAYALRTVAAAAKVASSSGIVWQAGPLPRAVSAFDTLLVAGGDGIDTAQHHPALRALVQRAARSPRVRLASVCSGSLLLAAAGVLDGRRATTHWCRVPEFRQRFPQVMLEDDRLHTRDGRVWTSAGISAGIDLALAIIGTDLGDAVARQVAQQLVLPQRRSGGQSQFSELLALQPAQGRFATLLDQVRNRLTERHGVNDLAERACMSPRHFARCFERETGTPPAKAVERLRVEAARAALTDGAASVQQVASGCGFGSADRMRRSFLRVLGTVPSALKPRPGRAV